MKKNMLILALGAALVFTACGSDKAADTQKASEAVTESVTEAVTEAVTETETEAVTEVVTEPASETEKETEKVTEEATEKAAAESTEKKENTETQKTSEVKGIQKFDPEKGFDYDDGTVKVTLADAEGGAVTISYKDASAQVNEFSCIVRTCYLFPGEDGAFNVLVNTEEDDDWEYTYMVSYTPSKGFTVGSETDGGIEKASSVTETGVTLTSRVDILGTYEYTLHYTISGTTLKADSNYKEFTGEAKKTDLTLTADLEAEAEDGSDVTVYAGDTIHPEGVDEKSKTFYFTYDGQTCHVSYKQAGDDYYHTINGVGEDDLFESLPYAG